MASIDHERKVIDSVAPTREPAYEHALVLARYLGAICTRAGMAPDAVSRVESGFATKIAACRELPDGAAAARGRR